MSKGNNWQQKNFTVALDLSSQGRKNYDNIFIYCQCENPAIAGLLDKQKRLRCANCGKPIRR